jgi:hypothetical protein
MRTITGQADRSPPPTCASSATARGCTCSSARAMGATSTSARLTSASRGSPSSATAAWPSASMRRRPTSSTARRQKMNSFLWIEPPGVGCSAIRCIQLDRCGGQWIYDFADSFTWLDCHADYGSGARRAAAVQRGRPEGLARRAAAGGLPGRGRIDQPDRRQGQSPQERLCRPRRPRDGAKSTGSRRPHRRPDRRAQWRHGGRVDRQLHLRRRPDLSEHQHAARRAAERRPQPLPRRRPAGGDRLPVEHRRRRCRQHDRTAQRQKADRPARPGMERWDGDGADPAQRQPASPTPTTQPK